MKNCPFNIGDVVIYQPSQKGLGFDANSKPQERLKPGNKYTIANIEKENYIVVEGYSHPGGGLYWTEFSAVSSNDNNH